MIGTTITLAKLCLVELYDLTTMTKEKNVTEYESEMG